MIMIAVKMRLEEARLMNHSETFLGMFWAESNRAEKHSVKFCYVADVPQI